MSVDQIIEAGALVELAGGVARHPTCSCLKHDLKGWANWPVGYRDEDFRLIGTLARHPPEESTLDEYHPCATSYWSVDAPIAPRFYPYNQSTVWACRHCTRVYLRHNDDGAYHVAPRIRLLQAELIVDAAHVHDGRDVGQALA